MACFSKKPKHLNAKKKRLASKSGIQTCQILTNDDEVCIPSLSSMYSLSCKVLFFKKSLLALEKCIEIYFDLKLSYSLQIFFPLLNIRERIFADALFYEWSYFGIVITMKLIRDSDNHLAAKTKFHIKIYGFYPNI